MPPKKKYYFANTRIFQGSTRIQGFNSVRKIWNSVGNDHLNWYCQMCEKQCRDEVGFRTHCHAEFHQKQMQLFAENAEEVY
jgi:hypothetical protein